MILARSLSFPAIYIWHSVAPSIFQHLLSYQEDQIAFRRQKIAIIGFFFVMDSMALIVKILILVSTTVESLRSK
jgi:hypothetical protein